MKPSIDQQINLLTLAKGLLSLPEEYKHFDMTHYFDSESIYQKPCELDVKDYNGCGTSACAAGHGPSFGIKAEPLEGWTAYIERVFGVDEFDATWNFLFDPGWNNDPKQAATRIIMFLEKGKVPYEYDRDDTYTYNEQKQRWGIYRTPLPVIFN